MASHSYMSITGEKMGLISAGCSTQDSIGNKCQVGHTDQILLLALNHTMTSFSNVSHAVHNPILIHKPLDKSTPLLAQALADREALSCEIDLYRTFGAGQQKYFSLLLKGARIVGITLDIPDVLMFNDAQPAEQVMLRYESITWKHHAASTSGFAFWGVED